MNSVRDRGVAFRIRHRILINSLESRFVKLEAVKEPGLKKN